MNEDDLGLPEAQQRALRTFALVTAVGAAFLLSYRAGLPLGTDGKPDLPDTALGWPLLLHVERSAALLATVGAVVLIAARAAVGRYPSVFGPVTYEVAEAAREAAEAQDKRLELLEDTVGLPEGTSGLLAEMRTLAEAAADATEALEARVGALEEVVIARGSGPHGQA